MPPAVIAGGVAAAGAIGGAVLSSKAQKKATKSSANTAQQTATQNNALQEKIYNSNAAYLNPYSARGNEAGSAINALLGISGTGGAQGTQQYGQPVLVGGATPPATAVTSPTDAYQNAFQNYLGSTGYQFQIDQGNKAINQGYAAKGSLQSGAALKALQTYGQNTATGFFKDYLGLLSNQQGVGLSGASAIAGVGQNYANAANANNTAAGNATANAALLAGNANANMYGNIAGAVGGLANVFGSSYRP